MDFFVPSVVHKLLKTNKMKKVTLLFALLLGGALCMNAQGDFRAGVHVGPNIGDTSDFSSFNFGVDASYLFSVSDLFGAGIAIGYSSYPGKDDYDNFSIIPIAASGRVGFAENWFAGLDLGYAIATEDAGGDGGFYYQPRIGWTMGTFDLFAYYQGISVKDSSFDVSGLGVGGAIKL